MKNLNFKKGFHSIHSDVKIDDKLEYVLGRLDYIMEKRENLIYPIMKIKLLTR